VNEKKKRVPPDEESWGGGLPCSRKKVGRGERTLGVISLKKGVGPGAFIVAAKKGDLQDWSGEGDSSFVGQRRVCPVTRSNPSGPGGDEKKKLAVTFFKGREDALKEGKKSHVCPVPAKGRGSFLCQGQGKEGKQGGGRGGI